jgi:hypothetical protein
MHNMTVDLVLTGVRAGQTVVLNNHSFVRGRATIVVEPQAVDALLTYMARANQAYLAGSEDLENAQERDRALRAAVTKAKESNGVLGDIQAAPASPDGASAPVQGDRDHGAGQVPDPRALHGGVDAPSEAGREGLVSGGRGHEDTGLGHGVVAGQNVKPVALTDNELLLAHVKQALVQLDPKTDDHWTPEGFPAVAAIAEALHDQSVTREVVEMAAPGYNRRKAEDLAAL